MEWGTKYDYILEMGWDSSVSIVTHYRLKGPGIESQWGFRSSALT